MPGIRISIASLLAAGLASAAAPDYLPLAPGNQWIYRAGGQTLTVEVLRIEGAYFVVRGFPNGEVRLRRDDDGTLYALDARGGRESVWAAFGAPDGTEYDTVIDPCNRRARVVSHSARYAGPVGEFRQEALHIAYPPSGCADAGITEEFYLPWVGLVRRTVTTIAGPVTYDLVYARLGGVTVISEPGLSVGLLLNRQVYYVNLMPPVDPRRVVPELTARLSLRNGTETPLEVVFPSGQNYDLEIRNARDELLHRWSDGRAFTMIFRRETLAPGQERNYLIAVPLGDKDGKPFPDGRYTAEAWFATEGGKRYAARLPFEIQTTH
ncbi:MAG: hypothetical protein HY822_08295 [Acidobacteria bacterium]|nr:hypothetical protein [Acidobacteriota bacterium]